MSQTTLYYIQVTMVTDMLRIQISKTGFNYVYVNNYIYKLYIYIYMIIPMWKNFKVTIGFINQK